jgi:hypothetical protein
LQSGYLFADEMMKPEEITKFFDGYVRGFMENDINNATDKAGANFLVALGLSVYTEVMGGLVTGELKNSKMSGDNYREFLKYMGKYYVDLDKQINLYSRVRCGLAHEYFIKGANIIARVLVDASGSPDRVPGILHSSNDSPLVFKTDTGDRTLPEDTIAFGIRNYFRDFMRAVEQYHADLLRSGNEKLVARFEKALKPR